MAETALDLDYDQVTAVTIPELKEYVLVHQKQMLVERFERKFDNLWVSQIVRDRDTLELKGIGFSEMVAALYENTNLLT
jgi:hypothetical protein